MEHGVSIIYEGKEYQITPVWSAKRRSLGITVKPDGTILLSIPVGYPLEDALSFAQSKAAWIAKYATRFRARENGDDISHKGRTESIVYGGKEYQITPVWSAKRSSLGISVKEDGTVLLRIPSGYPLEDALIFAQSKAAWIAEHAERFRAREVPHRRYAEGDEISFFGKTYTIRRSVGPTVRASFSGDELLLSVPEDFSEAEAENACRTAVIFLFRREGTAVLKPFTEKYAKLCGVAVPALRVRVQERKWGCCTPKNGIIINVKMMLAPQFAAEYLIVHEVAHLKYRNHQAEFWAEVKRLMPEYEKAEEMLKKDGWMWEF